MILTLNTGMDDANRSLSNGSVDNDFSLIGYGSTYVVNNGIFPLDGNWLADGPNSNWIAPSPTASAPSFTSFDYQTSFDLTGLDASTFQITGSWAVDNEGLDILINGISTGITINPPDRAGFRELHTFTINTGLISGVNTLDFIVHNDEGPTG